MPAPDYRPHARYATPEEKWHALVVPVDGGHLDWIGPRTPKGSPRLEHCGTRYSPAAMAYRMRTGHDPVGRARADCGRTGCVAPDHVEDTPGRTRTRALLRAVDGRSPRAEVCVRGHDQAEHGRFRPDGRVFCLACRRGEQPDQAEAAPVPDARRTPRRLDHLAPPPCA